MENKQIPEHYTFGDINSMQFITSVLEHGGFTAKEAFCVGNVLKYVIRSPRKGGVEDYRKAMTYLELLINRENEWKDPKPANKSGYCDLYANV